MPSTSDGAAVTSSNRTAAAAAPPTGSSNDNNRNRRGNRRNKSRSNTNSNNYNNNKYKDTRFEGREPSLRGYVYDFTGERNPEQWIKTTKEIVSHIGRTYTKYTSEFTEAVRELTLANPEAPEDPDTTNVVALEL